MRYMHVVFDNVPFASGFDTGWGYAAVVCGYERGILFDSGADGEQLLSNMDGLGIAPETIEVVVISHAHYDHTGGLSEFLKVNPKVEVYVPDGISCDVVQMIDKLGAYPIIVGPPGEIFEGVSTTGTMDGRPPEQGLILEGGGSAALVTGCAHPGIVTMLEEAEWHTGYPIEMVVGGIHLHKTAKKDALETAKRMHRMGVRRVALSHCTGEKSSVILEEVFGDGYIESGLGRAIVLDQT